MTTRRSLRDVAALFVEAGRSVGQVDQCKALDAALTELLEAANGTDKGVEFDALLQGVRILHHRNMVVHDNIAQLANGQRASAEALLHELEHPGARLARRLVSAARAVRHAWRTAR